VVTQDTADFRETELILIGQYDSPFVRRVGIALRLYGHAYEHRPWSTFGDADQIAPLNPLRRVPTLVLDKGEVLIESGAILDHLDEIADPSARLIPERGPARRQVLKICALATGLADKAVSLFYERLLHPQTSQAWIDRCTAQITDVLEALETDRVTRTNPWWFGDTMGHADIAVACVLRFVREAHPGMFDEERWSSLTGHATRCESLDVFRQVEQPFIPPR
jgi:glutathione S-transferase